MADFISSLMFNGAPIHTYRHLLKVVFSLPTGYFWYNIQTFKMEFLFLLILDLVQTSLVAVLSF